MVYDIVPGAEAKIQVTFFDGVLKGKEAIGRAFVLWIFGLLPVNRVAAPIREDARSVREYMERVGLVFEGIKRDWQLVTPLERSRRDKKEFRALLLYGVTRSDAENPGWRRGRHKPHQLVHFRWNDAQKQSGIGQSVAGQ